MFNINLTITNTYRLSMIITIALILTFLVTLNFLLLIFSCNKTPKKVDNRIPPAINTQKAPKTLAPNQLKSHQLAPTGS